MRLFAVICIFYIFVVHIVNKFDRKKYIYSFVIFYLKKSYEICIKIKMIIDIQYK